MKSLVVYYSHTGRTRAVAEMIAAAVSGELEEIVEIGVERRGFMGFLRAGKGGMRKEKSKIEPPKKRPPDFDLVFVGSPVWGWNLVPGVRSYLSAVDLGGKPIALFSTMATNGEARTFASMRELAPASRVLGELPVSQQESRDKEALKKKVADWAKEIQAKVSRPT
jgi:flavodoxin